MWFSCNNFHISGNSINIKIDMHVQKYDFWSKYKYLVFRLIKGIFFYNLLNLTILCFSVLLSNLSNRSKIMQIQWEKIKICYLIIRNSLFIIWFNSVIKFKIENYFSKYRNWEYFFAEPFLFYSCRCRICKYNL